MLDYFSDFIVEYITELWVPDPAMYHNYVTCHEGKPSFKYTEVW